MGATFTLVAWAFAYVFTVCQAIDPGSFTAAVDPGSDRTWMELLFLSFTVLTSTGLSDVTPIEPFARSLVMLEQLAASRSSRWSSRIWWLLPSWAGVNRRPTCRKPFPDAAGPGRR